MENLLLTLADKGLVGVIAGYVLIRIDTRIQELSKQIAELVTEMRSDKR